MVGLASYVSKLDQWSDSVQLFIFDAVKLADIQQQFWTKECDNLRSQKHTLTLPTSFQGVRTSQLPGSTPLVSHSSCKRSIVGTACEPWSMRIVDDGSPALMFWSFPLSHDNLGPVAQQSHWLDDTVCFANQA